MKKFIHKEAFSHKAGCKVPFDWVGSTKDVWSRILQFGICKYEHLLARYVKNNLRQNFGAAFSSAEVISKSEWGGREPTNELTKLQLPVEKVIIAHTATSQCADKETCEKLVKTIQDYHMDSKKFDDIAFNFLIGGNGAVYEGRGWDNQGAHTKNHNANSIGIAFIGSFEQQIPTADAIKVFHELLAKGFQLQKLTEDYKLFGQCQLTPTISPGQALYALIKDWPHWSDNNNL